MDITVFGKTFSFGFSSKPISDSSFDSDDLEDAVTESYSGVLENHILDKATPDMLGGGEVIGIKESVVHSSPKDIRKMIDSNDIKLGSLLDALKSDYSIADVYKENEDMSKDTIIGSAMELMADDCCMLQPAYNKIVRIESTNKKLEEFLNTFIDKNLDIENRVWEWAFEIVKHGDLKLRRMEYKTSSGKNNVYYENVTEGYKVSRIEYLGTVLGFLDEELEEGNSILESKDKFVHFLSRKLPNRKKVEIKVRGDKDTLKDITCYKVWGSSLVDNARYIYRVVNLLDNMLVMSRIARSTQYNLIKVEVGNASPAKTQEVMMDVRRRIEGSTRMTKNKGMRSDPSPIPVNSNVYVPVREGKGDIQIDSVNESVDVRSIVDIDYFRNKEFAAIRVPQSYLGFEESLPGTMGNSSLVKMDMRYARNVQKGQNILRNGIKELCNNYLLYRGRVDEVDEFEVVLNNITSAEDATRVEDFISQVSVFDSITTLLSEFKPFLSKPKLMNLLLKMMRINPSDIGSETLINIVKRIEDGLPFDDLLPKEPSEDDEDI